MYDARVKYFRAYQDILMEYDESLFSTQLLRCNINLACVLPCFDLVGKVINIWYDVII